MLPETLLLHCYPHCTRKELSRCAAVDISPREFLKGLGLLSKPRMLKARNVHVDLNSQTSQTKQQRHAEMLGYFQAIRSCLLPGAT